MSQGPPTLSARCPACGTTEEREDSRFCRKCGGALDVRGLAKPQKTVDDGAYTTATGSREASLPAKPDTGELAKRPPVDMNSAVARLITKRMGPPLWLAIVHWVIRIAVGIGLSLVAAAFLGYLREEHGRDVARALSFLPKRTAQDLVFGGGILPVTALISWLVVRLTSTKWKRIKTRRS